MLRQIFVNLPIKDMARSQAFFRALGLEFNPQFTNEQGACLVIAENIYAMLLSSPSSRASPSCRSVTRRRPPRC